MQEHDLLGRLLSPAAMATLPAAVRARLVLSNQIALLLAGVAALGIAANLARGDGAMTAGSALLLVLVAGVPALNAHGRYGASRTLLVYGGPVLLLGPSLVSGSVLPANVSAVPYAVLTMALLPGLVYLRAEESRARLAANLYLGGVLATHDLALRARAELAFEDGLVNVKLTQMVLWLALLATMRFVEEQPRSND